MASAAISQGRKRRLRVLYFEAGSGHMTAAKGLARALAPRLGEDWDVAPLDLVELFEPGSRNDGMMRKGIDDFNDQIRREKVFDLRGRINLGRLFNSWLLWRGQPEMAGRWGQLGAADVLVSVTPMYNTAVCASLRRVVPQALCVTIPVDFEQCKRRYWFDTRQAQHYLCAKPRLGEQAKRAGVPASAIHSLSGMVIAPDFYKEAPADRRTAMVQAGLDPDLPLGVAHFGAQGSKILVDIARALDGVDRPIQMLFLCGRSQEIRQSVEALNVSYPRQVMGFTEQPPHHYYRLADFLIGKPGAMTITEALITRTPILAMKSTGMAPVQRGNERWVERQAVGVVVPEAQALPQALARVLDDASGFARRIDAAQHQGLDDAVDAIASLIADHDRASS